MHHFSLCLTMFSGAQGPVSRPCSCLSQTCYQNRKSCWECHSLTRQSLCRTWSVFLFQKNYFLPMSSDCLLPLSVIAVYVFTSIFGTLSLFILPPPSFLSGYLSGCACVSYYLTSSWYLFLFWCVLGTSRQWTSFFRDQLLHKFCKVCHK